MRISEALSIGLLLALLTAPSLLAAGDTKSSPSVAASKQKYTFKRNYSTNERFQYLLSTSTQFDFKYIALGDVVDHLSQDSSSQVKGLLTILETQSGVPIVERFAFDDGCGEVSRRSGQAPKMVKAKYAGKLVTMKLQRGQVAHDLDGPADQRVNRMFSSLSDSDTDYYPPKPVSIGETWDIGQKMQQRMIAATGIEPQVSAFCKLKSVKLVDGKTIAELALSVGMMVNINHLEMQLEGIGQMDLDSGRIMQLDLSGAVTASGGRNVRTKSGRIVRVNAVGDGKMEYHQRSTKLPDQRLAGQENQPE
jgi:hypothetical protein